MSSSEEEDEIEESSKVSTSMRSAGSFLAISRILCLKYLLSLLRLGISLALVILGFEGRGLLESPASAPGIVNGILEGLLAEFRAAPKFDMRPNPLEPP